MLGENTEELERSDSVRRIVLRRRVSSESDELQKPCGFQIRMGAIQRPTSNPEYHCKLSKQSIASLRSRDSVHQYKRQQYLPTDKLDLLGVQPVTCISDPLPRSRVNVNPHVSQSPDLGYVSVTSSRSPSLLERLDQVRSF